MTDSKQVYILSLEASDIFSHMHRDTFIKYDYCGMIPYSLELIKLRKEGLKIKYIESRDKEISNDIINIKFNQKVKSGNELKKILSHKIENAKDNVEYIENANKFLNTINNGESWEEVSVSELRKRMYNEGFTLKLRTPSGDYKETEYVVYKRSSAKSRTGQCLFIKKSLYSKMIKWSRMNLPFKKNTNIDLAGLLAYESLVGSSLESTIKINPEKILLVEDVDSRFLHNANVVKKGQDGFLDSFREEVEVVNSLFDGESLLESKYFEDGISMKLLRNHMFKSAAFNCNIQQYLKDHKPEDVSYEEWKIKDMYGNDVYAKDVELITTPNSLKALKFSKVIGTDEDMYNYWKQKVNEDESLFGVCKHDKQSKFGEDEDGNILQQTSYQMINCLPMNEKDTEKLTETEKKYIDRLKNDDEFFVKKVHDASSLINSNNMLTQLYKINKDIVNTKLFRKFRKDFIWGHMSHTKRGKIKLKGDYCVMLGNPIEFLKHSIGKLNMESQIDFSLKENEVHTTLFDFNKEYVGFRNPNTSPSNVLIVKNKKVSEIDRYFNLTDNIVCVNAIKFPLQDILSGCDYDSDTVLLFDDEKLLELGKKSYGNYQVCINAIEGQKKKYKLNKHDMFEIDDQLSSSQRNIGKVVNLGQFCMSAYWDLINNENSPEIASELLKKVDVMTVLSGIAIDMAKKFYEINIQKEIQNVESHEFLKNKKKKPNFWQYVSQSKTIKNRIMHYDCPMDYLISELNGIEQAERKQNIPFSELLIEKETKKVNYKQFDKIIEKMKILDNFIKSENAKLLEKDEKFIAIEDLIKECNDYLKKLKINEDTMHVLIKYVVDTDSKMSLRLFNSLFNTHLDLFLKSFKNGDFQQ
ncbi:hypothetical protein ANABIO32_00210 [Rossellomorea marisflavi]|uniref:hypothetical protein n=1 Tax=Rossellomorea marisflavi TaxID=189381 RepID=UPI0025CA983F|nr:hypothetical protein [Rossellomorea marisflavi]GLI82335.1 hypothetical protein ANABIO32_00210 [Rossellomorea marisflavi]